MRIALAKFRSARRASHQPVFMSSCLTISHACLPDLTSAWVSPCVPCVFYSGTRWNDPVSIFVWCQKIFKQGKGSDTWQLLLSSTFELKTISTSMIMLRISFVQQSTHYRNALVQKKVHLILKMTKQKWHWDCLLQISKYLFWCIWSMKFVYQITTLRLL